LPDHEARYIGVEPRLPVGEYRLTVRDVPVDGFWSVSVYNKDGHFESNARAAYSINNLTGLGALDESGRHGRRTTRLCPLRFYHDATKTHLGRVAGALLPPLVSLSRSRLARLSGAAGASTRRTSSCCG
jgi:uncharacterized protein DUF1214